MSNDAGDDTGLCGLVNEAWTWSTLAVIPTRAARRIELEDADAGDFDEGADRLAEAVANLLEQGRRRNGVSEVLGQEGDNLASDLQIWDVAIQIHAVQAFEVQHHVTVEHIIDAGQLGHPAISTTRILLTATSPECAEAGSRLDQVAHVAGVAPETSA